MLLPNADQAVIPAEKLRDYVLDSEHKNNQGKARYFGALGYSMDNWQDLERDLRLQHLTQDAVEADSDFGFKWVIDAPLQGPKGRGRILSVWIIDFGSTIPRFVTARPNTR